MPVTDRPFMAAIGKSGYIPERRGVKTPRLSSGTKVIWDSALADSEHLRPANRTGSLRCGLSVLHRNTFSILHFLFCSTFDTVCLHG